MLTMMATDTPCAHHWVIEGQHGPVSDAQCSKCYAERTFSTPYMNTYGNPQQKFPKIALQRAEDWDD